MSDKFCPQPATIKRIVTQKNLGSSETLESARVRSYPASHPSYSSKPATVLADASVCDVMALVFSWEAAKEDVSEIEGS
jgi:hypothetical protein